MELRQKQIAAILFLLKKGYCAGSEIEEYGYINCNDCYLVDYRKRCIYNGNGRDIATKNKLKNKLEEFNPAEILTVLLKHSDVL